MQSLLSKKSNMLFKTRNSFKIQWYQVVKVIFLNKIKKYQVQVPSLRWSCSSHGVIKVTVLYLFDLGFRAHGYFRKGDYSFIHVPSRKQFNMQQFCTEWTLTLYIFSRLQFHVKASTSVLMIRHFNGDIGDFLQISIIDLAFFRIDSFQFHIFSSSGPTWKYKHSNPDRKSCLNRLEPSLQLSSQALR